MESSGLIISSKMLRDAKAGNYVPTNIGKFKSFIYPYSIVDNFRNLLDNYPTLLDISFYQITANFNTMIDNGIDGVIIRAGQNKWEDSKAATFMKSAESVNMPTGSYWFYDSRYEPKEQAKLWANILDGHETKLWCWADYEENYGGKYSGWNQFYNFLEYCRLYMPERKIGIYTGYYYWLEHSPSAITNLANLNYFGQYPLWLAWYIDNPAYVKIPRPWKEMVFWQYKSSGDGYKFGVGSREVDMNRFMLTNFKETFGIQNNGEEPMPEKPITYYADLRAGLISNVRQGAGQSYAIKQPITGPLTVSIVGEKMDNPNDIYDWYEIIAPTSGFIALTSNYTNLRPADTIPTPTPSTLPDTLYIGTKADGSDLQKYNKAG